MSPFCMRAARHSLTYGLCHTPFEVTTATVFLDTYLAHSI
jgi:hypothetical protein